MWTAVKAFMSEDVLDYVSGLRDIVSLRIHPAVQKNDEALMADCLENVLSMNCLTRCVCC